MNIHVFEMKRERSRKFNLLYVNDKISTWDKKAKFEFSV